RASSPGTWASVLRITVNHATRDPSDNTLVTILVNRLLPGVPVETLETHRNVSLDPNSSAYIVRFLAGNSELIRVAAGSVVPATFAGDVTNVAPTAGSLGADGTALDNATLRG